MNLADEPAWIATPIWGIIPIARGKAVAQRVKCESADRNKGWS